jgi:hypothetical protein
MRLQGTATGHSYRARLQDTAVSCIFNTVYESEIAKYVDWLRQCSYVPPCNQNADNAVMCRQVTKTQTRTYMVSDYCC